MSLTSFEYRVVEHEGARAEVINPYLQCSYECAYCYCRPDRQAAWIAAGKPRPTGRIAARWQDLPRRLRVSGCQYTYIGTAVDPYPVWERRGRVTRRVLRACAQEGRNVVLATKSALILDDARILTQCAGSVVFVSVASLDEKWRATFEPQVPSAKQRIACVGQLVARGVTTAVFIAPILPGHNDRPAHIAAVVRTARDAGASLIVAGLSTPSLGSDDGNWRGETTRWLATLATEAPVLHAPGVMQKLGPIPPHALYWPDPGRAFGILTTHDGKP